MATENFKLENVFTKLGLFFFKSTKLSICIWLVIVGLSLFIIYGNVIKKEGYPPVQYPITTISGVYFDEAQNIDQIINRPLTQAIYSLENVDMVTTTATDNAFHITVEFQEGVEAQAGTDSIQQLIEQRTDLLPDDLNLKYVTYNPAEYLFEYNLLLALYVTEGRSDDLESVASAVANILNEDNQITNATVQPLSQTAVSSISQEVETKQTAFNYLTLRENSQLQTYPSIIIGLNRSADSNLDLTQFSDYINQKLNQLDFESLDGNYQITIAADFGQRINHQLQSLQVSLITALVTVVIISWLLISWRVSSMTALFIIISLLTSILVLYLIGYSLNMIVLFSLVLSLGLLVDDAVVMAESLALHKTKYKSKKHIIKTAITKVSLASFAGTMTTILAFSPLLFVSGYLGEFIRIMPITIIIALLTSFILSIILIPFLAKFILLPSPKFKTVKFKNPISKLEASLAYKLANRIRQLDKPNQKRAKYFPIFAVIISLIMIMISINYARQMQFNIFPANDDSNQLVFRATFPHDYNLEDAQNMSQQISHIIIDEVDNNLEQIVYINANRQTLQAEINLTRYQNRQLSASQIATDLRTTLNQSLVEANLDIEIAVDTPGAPTNEYPLRIQVFATSADKGQLLINQLNEAVLNQQIARPNGSVFNVVDSRLPDYDNIKRIDGQQVFELALKFDADDISTLVRSTTSYLKTQFDKTYLLSQGFPADSLDFDAGIEADNINSFRSLIYIMPLIVIIIYVMLAIQFKSLIQPFLILTAVPFAFFGVFIGLYYTNNAISFFTILGLAGLIGIAVNNTILLTDCINQARKQKMNLIQAVATGIEQRFRPLITTSLTTIVALIPLALGDPLWQALSLTIIFGLLSSTFLVVLSFPYYFIIVETLRSEYALSRKNKQDKK